MRKAAKAEKINVMGTLWIMQKMFDEQLLTKQQAAEAYEKMREGRRRLPWHLVEKQLNGFVEEKRGKSLLYFNYYLVDLIVGAEVVDDKEIEQIYSNDSIVKLF